MSYQSPPNSTFKILISTDNHLGYNEPSYDLGEDSFRTFEEVLHLAVSNNVDMLLLAGDLFHENKPSRKTLYKTMRLLRTYCFSSTPKHNLSTISNPSSSYSNVPSLPVSLPVYVIHGNHDDPTGGPPNESLSALDLLEMAGLVTYFGRARSSCKIHVAPVLLRKGNSGLALYGLGNIRDEILYHTWQNLKAVSWLEPTLAHSSTAQEASQITPNIPWFSLFALHQNRYTRGSSRAISETLLPKWLNYVVWGHEHESIPHLTSTKPPIVQPGSTVATSLSVMESGSKNAVMIEVCAGKLVSHKPVPLHTVRNFKFRDISLTEVEGISQRDPKEKVERALLRIVDKMLTEQNILFDQRLQAFRNGIRMQDINGIMYPPHSFYVEKLTPLLRMPLIRLRVDKFGTWNTPNSQAFGRNYTECIASPWRILLYYRRKQRLPLKRSRPFLQGESTGPMPPSQSEAMNNDKDEDLDFTRNQVDNMAIVDISTLVQENIVKDHEGNPGLKFLEIDGLSNAVHEFVNHEATKEIARYMNEYLSSTQKKTANELIRQNRRVDEMELLEKYKRNATKALNRFMGYSHIQKKDGISKLGNWKRRATSASARKDAESFERLFRGKRGPEKSAFTKDRKPQDREKEIEDDMPVTKFERNGEREREMKRRRTQTRKLLQERLADDNALPVNKQDSVGPRFEPISSVWGDETDEIQPVTTKGLNTVSTDTEVQEVKPQGASKDYGVVQRMSNYERGEVEGKRVRVNSSKNERVRPRSVIEQIRGQKERVVGQRLPLQAARERIVISSKANENRKAERSPGGTRRRDAEKGDKTKKREVVKEERKGISEFKKKMLDFGGRNSQARTEEFGSPSIRGRQASDSKMNTDKDVCRRRSEGKDSLKPTSAIVKRQKQSRE